MNTPRQKNSAAAPEHYCPICDARIRKQAHRCKQSVIAALDAQDRDDEPHNLADYQRRPIGERLTAGFKWLSNDPYNDGDGDDDE